MTTSTQIRKFRWDDVEEFTHLFNAVNGIADSEKASDPEFMRQFLSQPSCRPEEHCFLAEHDRVLVGFALVSPEPPISRAVIGGGVLESHRSRGIGRSLTGKATEHAAALNVSVINVQAPANGSAARHLLESEGFVVVKNYWQLRWEGDEDFSIKMPEGFSLRPFTLDQDEQMLADLQNAAFGHHWGFSPNSVEEIRARVRLDRSPPEGIIFVLDGSRPAGYNWTLRASNGVRAVGWIAMTGVHPDYRGRGLGTAVVLAGMEYLKNTGVDGIELEVDSENVPATKLYANLGFKKVDQTVWYEKRLG